MPDDDAVKRIEARLTRAEAALAQSGGRPQPIVDLVVDANPGDKAGL